MAAKRGTFFWGGIGALAIGLSKGFEAVGDNAFARGDRSTALTNHLLGLGMLIAGAGCGFMFFRALVRKQGLFGANDESPKRTAQIFEEGPSPGETFDPDAAFANYLAKRDQSPPPAAPTTQGFGRRIS